MCELLHIIGDFPPKSQRSTVERGSDVPRPANPSQTKPASAIPLRFRDTGTALPRRLFAKVLFSCSYGCDVLCRPCDRL